MVQKGNLDIVEIIEDEIAANTAVNVFTSGGRHRAAVFFAGINEGVLVDPVELFL